MNNELSKKIKETINYLRDYYLDWQDYIERFSFPRMDYYYLLINISSFYKMSDLSLYWLEKYNEDNEELDLLKTLICMPKKVYFTDIIYNNFKIIRNSLDYNNLVLEKYKEN